ncbi:hypothetical protein WBJ53_03330 [Spirosoma sp. SC4-14]|uniref:hypothetical protein n=1 Tax=Spirosoma sp. SC4-14 TaxID=3128900 RepID=UPI0030CCF4C0
MKTSLKFFASAFAFLLSVSVSFGFTEGDQPQEKAFAIAMFPANGESKVWLCLEKYKANDKISVELVNEKGQVMFHEALPGKGGKRNGYRQQFDLSQVGDGNYTFRISNGNQVEERTFKLSTPTLEQQMPVRLISMN